MEQPGQAFLSTNQPDHRPAYPGDATRAGLALETRSKPAPVKSRRAHPRCSIGGPGAPVVLVHHRGRTSGRDYVNPMMYLPDDNDPDTIYVFATKGGAPTNRTGTTTSSQPARAPSSEAPTRIR
jgi:hypothetical protein